MRLGWVLAAVALVLVSASPGWTPKPKTVAEVVARHEAAVRSKFEPLTLRSGICWPPKRLCLLAFKREKLLEVWAANAAGAYGLIGEFRILAASGGIGPKRMEGDRQVPEGFYEIPSLNPNSRFHLSIFVNYPNATDIRNSQVRRGQMGGEIYIHGGSASIGCIAIGDRAIEELFTLCALVPAKQRKILISPVDFRSDPSFTISGEDPWVLDLYDRIRSELSSFPRTDRR